MIGRSTYHNCILHKPSAENAPVVNSYRSLVDWVRFGTNRAEEDSRITDGKLSDEALAIGDNRARNWIGAFRCAGLRRSCVERDIRSSREPVASLLDADK
jgi:hypothetical protein